MAAEKQIVDHGASRAISAEEIKQALEEGRLDLTLHGNDGRKGAKLSPQQVNWARQRPRAA